MIDFYEKEKSDRFEILAFHDATVKSFEELDEKLATIKDKHWKGRALPFPILLDASGETVKQYGIHAFPTTILIDPDGHLVGEATEVELKKALEKERARQ
jgi:peroxiredoxin